MGHVQESYHVDAPIEHVWEIAHDCSRILEFWTGLVDVRDCSGRLDRVGASFTYVYRAFGRTMDVHSETTTIERPLVSESTLTAPGGGRGMLTGRFMRSGDGTEVTYTIDYELPGGFVGSVADRLLIERAIERDMHHTAQNFKELCESLVRAPA